MIQIVTIICVKRKVRPFNALEKATSHFYFPLVRRLSTVKFKFLLLNFFFLNE